VAEHIIKIAQALRRHNDFFTSHGLVAGVRSTLWPGDLMFKHFARTESYKTFLSLETLFASARASGAYRYGLQKTTGPAIVDL
jgi:hypothetical protein